MEALPVVSLSDYDNCNGIKDNNDCEGIKEALGWDDKTSVPRQENITYKTYHHREEKVQRDIQHLFIYFVDFLLWSELWLKIINLW